jgi:hypothetical protein
MQTPLRPHRNSKSNARCTVCSIVLYAPKHRERKREREREDLCPSIPPPPLKFLIHKQFHYEPMQHSAPCLQQWILYKEECARNQPGHRRKGIDETSLHFGNPLDKAWEPGPRTTHAPSSLPRPTVAFAFAQTTPVPGRNARPKWKKKRCRTCDVYKGKIRLIV